MYFIVTDNEQNAGQGQSPAFDDINLITGKLDIHIVGHRCDSHIFISQILLA